MKAGDHMSSLHRLVLFGILLVALASGIWFIHNGGITSHENYIGGVTSPTPRPVGFHLVPGFDGSTEELAFRGVSCHTHAAWSNDLYGECHHEAAVRN
jgi:hypothetical protein